MRPVKLNCPDEATANDVRFAFTVEGFRAATIGTAVITTAVWGRNSEIVADIMANHVCLPRITSYNVCYTKLLRSKKQKIKSALNEK